MADHHCRLTHHLTQKSCYIIPVIGNLIRAPALARQTVPGQAVQDNQGQPRPWRFGVMKLDIIKSNGVKFNHKIFSLV